MAKHIPYDIDIYDNDEFDLSVKVEVDRNKFANFFDKAIKKFSTDGEIPDEFEIDDRYYDNLKLAFKKTIELINKDLKKDKFKIIYWNIDKATYKTIDENKMLFSALISGVVVKQ